MLTAPWQKRIESRVMGQHKIRRGASAVILMLWACPALAVEDVEPSNFTVETTGNSVVPPPSEEALVFTGRDEKPLTPSRNGFREGVDNVVAGAQAISSWLGPETWMLLIVGFGVVGFVVRSSERVLRFEPRRDTIDRTDHPEDRTAASSPDASTRPHSGSDPAPSARRDQAE